MDQLVERHARHELHRQERRAIPQLPEVARLHDVRMGQGGERTRLLVEPHHVLALQVAGGRNHALDGHELAVGLVAAAVHDAHAALAQDAEHLVAVGDDMARQHRDSALRLGCILRCNVGRRWNAGRGALRLDRGGDDLVIAHEIGIGFGRGWWHGVGGALGAQLAEHISGRYRIEFRASSSGHACATALRALRPIGIGRRFRSARFCHRTARSLTSRT